MQRIATVLILKFPVQNFCLISRRNTGLSVFSLVTTSYNAFRWITVELYIGHSPLLFRLVLYVSKSKVFVAILLKIWRYVKSVIQYNFLYRIAQIWETGIQARILQQYLASKEPEEQLYAIDISMVTVAPILVVLAAGFVIGIFVQLTERCVHGNICKYWSRGSVRRWRQIAD